MGSENQILNGLCSSRFSADANTLAVAQAQMAPGSAKLNDNIPKVRTPDSNMENKSFDSALYDMVGPTSGPSSVASALSGMSSNNPSNNSVSVSAMVPQNYHMQLHHPQRSNSTGSLSEKSQASTGIELGFNCDSPQGGTIRKKPKESTIATSASSENKPKPTKGVRFKESFATIPLDDLPPPPPLPYEALDFTTNQNGLQTRNSRSASFDLEAELECLPHVATNKLTRHIEYFMIKY